MIYNVAPEIEKYFVERYKKCGVRVVPGHWPEMKTKEDVDRWIELLKKSEEMLDVLFAEEEAQNGD
ncbi:MAG TPA: hypothetical protein DCM73_12465 [Clostridiales bacterium]|nr:hypothetical protein [Clostridiales bacterium]